MTYYARNLPHWHPEARSIFITWRLYGSLPSGYMHGIRNLHIQAGERFLATDLLLDAAATGPKWLFDPKIASCADAAIRSGAKLGQYVLHAYAVMPNHVHVLLDPLVPVKKITQGIKGISARGANLALRRTGEPFWQDESFDHWIRTPVQFERVLNYIERNPVKARLVTRPEDWRWSSAHQ